MAPTRFLMRNRHGSMWYARVVVPRHLRPLLDGKREIRRSTGHTDKRQASRFALRFWAECQALFEELEIRMADNNKPGRLRTDLVTITDALGNSHSFNFGGDKSPEAAERELAAAKEAQQTALDTLERFQAVPHVLDAIVAKQPPAIRDPNEPETVMTWEELYETYGAYEWERANDPTHRLKPKTFEANKPYRELWRAHFAGRKVHTIKRAEIGEIESWLRRLPAGFTKKKMTPSQAIKLAINGSHDHSMVSAATYNHYQRQLAGMLRYAHRKGAHNTDLSTSIAQINAKRGRKYSRHPFTNEEVGLIFCGENYTANFGRDNEMTPFAAKFWTPLIGAFSGARMDEICQLKVSDVRYDEEANCHYLNIVGVVDDDQAKVVTGDLAAPDGLPKHIKNKNSIRPIPIHPTLVEIGFLRYVDSLRQVDPEASLFGLQRAPDGKWGSPLTKWFTIKGRSTKGFIERCGVVSAGEGQDGKRWSKSFHSWRHTVIDNLRDRGKRLPDGSRITDDDIGLVVGHLEDDNSKLETRNYGRGRKNLEFRKSVINAISYNKIDWHLVRWS